MIGVTTFGLIFTPAFYVDLPMDRAAREPSRAGAGNRGRPRSRDWGWSASRLGAERLPAPLRRVDSAAVSSTEYVIVRLDTLAPRSRVRLLRRLKCAGLAKRHLNPRVLRAAEQLDVELAAGEQHCR